MTEEIIENLRNVFDPEISINVYDLGLIYEINPNGTHCDIVMTLTSAFCPAADMIIGDVNDAVCMGTSGVLSALHSNHLVAVDICATKTVPAR